MSRRPLPPAVALLCSALAALPCAAARQVTVNDRTFTVPDGFTVELVAGPPLVERPITADFDEHGRLYVADSSGSTANVQQQLKDKPHRIVRLEDTDNDGRFDRRTVFADHMMFPEGTLWLNGALYVAAPPSIWRLSDGDGDGVAEARAEWFQGKTLTGCANDLHGPYAGPDGRVYWCKGAFAKQTYERAGHKPFVTRAAHIFRSRPDGSEIETVMTGGMDNPVEVAFTPGGERIFTTTFLQHPAAGRRDGLIHAVYGGVYGKVHDVIDDHPRTGPDVMPVLAHLGPAASCGLIRYESDALGSQYRDNLFSTSFNLHKVFRHVLTPDGATFTSKDEDFLTCTSLDFHPTHLLEDADGSLLVVDTGGWYKLCCPTSQLGKPDVTGAIYRVRRTNAPHAEDPRGLKLAWDTMTPVDAAARLGDARPAVRKRAVQTLADRGAAALPAIVQGLRHENPLVRVNAVWAACRIDAPDARASVRGALADADETVRQAAAHAASVWRDREAAPRLVELLRAASPHNRRVAAEALGRLGDAAAVPALLSALERPADRVLEHSLTYALIEIGDARATRAGLTSANVAVRRQAMVALDQMEQGGLRAEDVAGMLSSPDAATREAAGWVAGRHAEWGDALAATLRARLGSGADAAEVTHQLAKLAGSEAVARLLAERVRDAAAPVAERRVALAAMAEAGPRDVPEPWLGALTDALAGSDRAVAAEAARVVRKLAPRKAAAERMTGPLVRFAGRGDVDAGARLEALAAVPAGAADVGADVFDFLVGQLASDVPTHRLAAAEALGRARLGDGQLVALAPRLSAAGALEVDRLLGAYARGGDDGVGMKLLDAVESAKARDSVRPETLRARVAKFGPAVRGRADALAARIAPDAAGQAARLDKLAASLPAGDVRRGQGVFNSAKVACASCHAIGYLGGNVGPDLTRVGAVRSERDLLESIAYPSASFVQSFEPVVVETADGDVQAGILRRNDAEEVVLVAGPDREVRIPRAEVKGMRPGTVSVMPAGLDAQLNPQELADLVAFLKGCR